MLLLNALATRWKLLLTRLKPIWTLLVSVSMQPLTVPVHVSTLLAQKCVKKAAKLLLPLKKPPATQPLLPAVASSALAKKCRTRRSNSHELIQPIVL